MDATQKLIDKKELIRRSGGLAACVAVIAAFQILTPFDGLSEEGMASIGIFLGLIILYITRVTPMAVSCLTVMVLMPFLGISSLQKIWSDFGGSTFFFVLFCFGITGALSNTNIPTRLAMWIAKKSKGNAKFIVYGFTFATAIMSGFMSNLVAVAMFSGVALVFLKLIGIRPGQSNLGRCLMISLPAASGVGGFIAPSGSSTNMLGLQLLEGEGITIRFLDWFLMCAPMALICCALISFFLCRLFKPESIDEQTMDIVIRKNEELGPLSRQERHAMVIVIITIVLWFVSTWISALNITVIAACAMFVMFLPGIDLMTWDYLVKEADWNILFMVGACGITVGCVNSTGAMAWIVNNLFSGIVNLPPLMLLLLIGLVIAGLRALIPTGPAVVSIFVPILMGIAQATGQSCVLFALIAIFWGGAAMLLVYTEPIFLYTFGYGYYTAGDMFKAGIIPTLIMVALLATVFPMMVSAFGY